MKYYKLENARVVEARSNDLLQCLGGDKGYSYYLSEKGEILQAPFEEIVEVDLPKEIRNRMITQEIHDTQERIKAIEIKKQEVQEALLSFSSDALGEIGIYDSDLAHQANLLQILSLGKGGKLRVKCDGQEKQYVFHTKEQVKQVMSDWVKHKDKILSKFEEFKGGI